MEGIQKVSGAKSASDTFFQYYKEVLIRSLSNFSVSKEV